MRDWDGTYDEHGAWYLADGRSGVLSGRVVIEAVGNRVRIAYDDGRSHEAHIEGVASSAACAALAGSAGDGTLYLTPDGFVLEYEADIDGRPEHNTDTWVRIGAVVRRTGVIRQPQRVIWYASEMRKRAS